MKILRFILTASIITCMGVIFSDVALSYSDIQIASPTNLLPGYPDTELASVSMGTAGEFIGNSIAWMISLTAVLTIIAITWSGVQMILATGEEEKMKKARHTMIYAFVGLVIAGIAYAVVSMVTNSNLDNFL